MGAVGVGDALLDEAGRPCRVAAVSDVMTAHDCYAITFDSGDVITADAGHLWLTFTDVDRIALVHRTAAWRAARRERRPRRDTGVHPWQAEANAARTPVLLAPPTGTLRTTAAVAATQTVGSRRRRNHTIAVAAALDLPEQPLPVPPYLLGVWLGDGNSRTGAVYVHADDAATLRRIAALGYALRKRPSESIGWGVLGLQAQLRAVGVLGNKHIPPAYLRASAGQRLELLRGLMDTDGSCDPDGGAEYTTTAPALADGVLELARSLGIKASLHVGRATLDGRIISDKYRVKMTTTMRIFHLERKAGRQPEQVRPTQGWHYLTAVTPVASVPVRCVTVDSPSHLYLAGRTMVPTHNSDLLLGMALTQHRRAIIFRREYPQLEALIDRSAELVGDETHYNRQAKRWELPDGRIVQFGAVQYDRDVAKFQGRPHDLKAFDELAYFTERQFRFLKAWNRTAVPSQRVRVVASTNPPTTAEGAWIVRYWAPWLDPHHPNPAAPGDLRWFAVVDREEREVDGPAAVLDPASGRWVQPRSRTFLPSRLEDNPYYMATGYGAVVDALPEPLRTQLREGDFGIGQDDDALQAIPTAWVRAAMGRWTPSPPGIPTTLGVDVARGGQDKTVLAMAHGRWLAPLQKLPGRATPDGGSVAARALQAVGGHLAVVSIHVDVIGVGSSAYDHLRPSGARVVPVNVAERSGARDRSGRFSFRNLRAEAVWKLREALDPEHGSDLAFPDDPELLADLCAPRWSLQAGGVIAVESKDDIKKRLGRSPDCGDAVMLALLPRGGLTWI